MPLSYDYTFETLEATVELGLRAGEAPMYIVHFSQDEALKNARALASYGVSDKAQREEIKQAMKGTKFTTPFGKILQRLLAAGVGVHHAGMLPRYRLLVERLAQQGLLPVICGTDTLGVGINVPIHTVVLTQLTKFDGTKMRRLRSREFHQIVGRAGRAGFDTEGMVVALAPEHEIENHKAMLKAGDDPKKQRRVKKKQPPEGFVSWNKQTFEHLIEKPPEKLTPRMRITHSMVLSVVSRGGDAWANVHTLIADSAQTPEEKIKLNARADEIFATLLEAGVVVRGEDAEGRPSYELTVELPEDFALDQPLSPFLLAALDLLDPESPDYALDVISLVEATLENPAKVLRAQERKARDAAMAEMKADGVEYEERLERLAEITYPKPLEELLDPRLRAVLPGRAVGPRLRAVAEERAARHGGDGERFQDLHRPLRHREVGGDASALPVRRLPRARAHVAARSAGRSAARHHRLARLHGAHHRLVAGGRVGERRRAARGRRAPAGGRCRGGRPPRHGSHGAQRAVRPRAPGRTRSHSRAGQPGRGLGPRASARGMRRWTTTSPSTTRSASTATRGSPPI